MEPTQRPETGNSNRLPLEMKFNRPCIKVRIGQKTCNALIDTGATHSFIADDVAAYCRTMGLPKVQPTLSSVKLASQKIVHLVEAYQVRMTIGSTTFTKVIPHLPQLVTDVVIGMDLLLQFQAQIDLATNQLTWTEGPAVVSSVEEQPDPIRTTSQSARPALTKDQENRLTTFLKEELAQFESIKGTTPLLEHHIRLENPEPIKQRYRPQNPYMQQVIREEVDQMLRDGIIEPSNSPWNSPVVIVRKKDGKHRFCIDFQKVNAVTKKDAYPLPHILGILDKLRQAKFISSIDLHQGYWQVRLSPDSKQITAFTVPGVGLFQFRVMPFGLHSAGSTFQRLMDLVIGPDLEPYCFAYLDDIIVLGDSFEHHLSLLQEVFRRLRHANLRLNPDKCQFGRRTLCYLGHLVTPEGIATDPGKVDAIRRLQAPKTVRGLRRFLGIVSWYRRYVPTFATIAAPLHKLLKKKQRWKWGPEQEAAFQEIKRRLTEAPVLTCPDFTKPFVLQTDASDFGLGAALTQDSEGIERIIAYASRSLSDTEKKYSVTEKECLAIVWGIEKMRPYLEGYHFTILTDHQCLKWLQSIKSPAGRLARWAMYLQQYDFTIKYRKGSLNRLADALSRDPLPATVCIAEDRPRCTWYNRKKSEVEKNPELFPDYCIREDQLYRRFWDSTDLTEMEMSDPWKRCLPKPSREAVLRENHDAPTAGHLGIARTIVRIAQRYYWPGMFRDIARYVRQCQSCLRFKTPQQKTPGLMRPSINRHPWETVSTDIVGPLPLSSKRSMYLLVFQDRFTKWVECQPVQKATAQVVVRHFYERVITRFGSPKTVISDNGTQYAGKAFNDLLAEWGIRHQYTPAYTPQANPVERMNKTLKTMIAQFCEGDHRTWDQRIPELMFAINSSRHESTGFSPAYLNFGRELEVRRGPPKTVRPPGDAQEEVTFSTSVISEEHLRRAKKLEETFELVRLNLGRAYTGQSHYYNLRRRDWRCNVGDLVLKKEHHLSSTARHFAAKLAPKFIGPCTVTRVVSPVVYDLKGPNGKVFKGVHIKDLRAAS